MQKTLAALIGLTFCSTSWSHIKGRCEHHLLADTATLFPNPIAQAQLGAANSWTISWHKTAEGQEELLALQQSTLILKRIDPLTGRELESRQIKSGLSSNDSVTLTSTKAGEALILLTQNSSRTVELLDSRSEEKIKAVLPSLIRSAELVALNNGRDVFVVANTADGLHVLKRQNKKLIVTATIAVPELIRNMFVVDSGDREAWIVIQNLDHKVQILKLSDEASPIRKITQFTQLGGQLFPTQINGQLALAIVDRFDQRATMSFYSSEGNKLSQAIQIEDLIGRPTASLSPDGHLRVLVPAIRGGKSELLVVDPLRGAVTSAIRLNGVRQINNLSSLANGSKNILMYSTETQMAYLQGSGPIKQIPFTPNLKQLTGTIQTKDGRTLLAILGQGQSGSRVNIIEITK